MLPPVVNIHEQPAQSRLKSVCKRYGASVHTKMRLADALPINNSGISNKDFRFALQSHFDFTIVDEQEQPLFAVEMDGHFHKTPMQKKRDIQKNQLCARFNLPLLRINSNYILKKYHDMDVLTWLVEAWFLSEAFRKAQQEGAILPWEPFIPTNFISIDEGKTDFYLWLSRKALLEIQKLHKAGVCKDFSPSFFIGFDKENIYRGIVYLRINNKAGVCTETAMRNQQFPVELDDILEEILICELYEKLTEVLQNKKAQPLSQIEEKFKKYRASYNMITAQTTAETL